MQKSTKRLAVAKSLYPLDYDKNNPMPGFPKWREHVRQEVWKNEKSRIIASGNIAVVVIPVEKLKAILNIESLRLQAVARLEGRRA